MASMSPTPQKFEDSSAWGKSQGKTPRGIDVVILGGGGQGKENAVYLRDIEGANLLGFIDDNKPKGPFAESVVIGNFDDLKKFMAGRTEPVFYITATGTNQFRELFVKKIRQIQSPLLLPYTLIHPSAHIGPRVTIGEGTCMAPRSAATVDVNVGAHCIVNVHTSLSHDVTVGDFTNVNPGVKICGMVTIGPYGYIGAGSTILDKIKIGENVTIGAGAVVTKDLPDNVTAVGVPARIIKEKKPVLK